MHTTHIHKCYGIEMCIASIVQACLHVGGNDGSGTTNEESNWIAFNKEFGVDLRKARGRLDMKTVTEGSEKGATTLDIFEHTFKRHGPTLNNLGNHEY